ncbi:MAG: flagellar basal body-associated FliL family protein [Peptococcia bacterium]
MKKVALIVMPVISILILAGAALLVYTQVIDRGDLRAEQRKIIKVGPLYESADLDFTVNVYGNTKRVIKAKVAFEVSDKKVLTELDEKLPVIKDQIISVLSMQELEDLATMAGKEDVKLAIMDAINSYLEKGEVTTVYFTDLIFS